MIAVIDYGAGNTFSVFNSLRYLGYDARVIDQPELLHEAERIILPGVGAFGECMDTLRRTGFVDALEQEVIHHGKPFLGICLGMQVLATTGTEKGYHKGLGWIPGVVSRFLLDERQWKIPHVGWNDIDVVRDNPLVEPGSKDKAYYFVHSYHFRPEQDSDILATCDYGGTFVCGVGRDNILGLQFHPEKSQKNGLAILEHFADWRLEC